tara:strand:+ start:948 stop:1154 length:207 start_codon:yes stop_codon:yes gene_type:complete
MRINGINNRGRLKLLTLLCNTKIVNTEKTGSKISEKVEKRTPNKKNLFRVIESVWTSNNRLMSNKINK